MYKHFHVHTRAHFQFLMQGNVPEETSPQGPAGGIKLRNQQSSENEHGYEMSNRIQVSFTSRTTMAVKTTNLERKKHDDGPIYECTEPVVGYAELS